MFPLQDPQNRAPSYEEGGVGERPTAQAGGAAAYKATTCRDEIAATRTRSPPVCRSPCSQEGPFRPWPTITTRGDLSGGLNLGQGMKEGKSRRFVISYYGKSFILLLWIGFD